MKFMRKFALMSAFLLLCAGLDVFAGDRFSKGKEPYPFDYEVRIGWGGYPSLDGDMLLDGTSFFGIVDTDMSYDGYYTLSNIYRDYRGRGYLTGIISAEFDLNFRRWFTLTIGAGFSGAWQPLYDAVTGKKTGRNSGFTVSLLPEARFNWLNRDLVRMYSAIGLGLTFSAYDERDYNNMELTLYPAFQFTPVGISAGRKVYGFAEVGMGTQFFGGMVGMGFRF